MVQLFDLLASRAEQRVKNFFVFLLLLFVFFSGFLFNSFLFLFFSFLFRCCLVCASFCHAGHKLGPQRHTEFYCDCNLDKNSKCFCLPFLDKAADIHMISSLCRLRDAVRKILFEECFFFQTLHQKTMPVAMNLVPSALDEIFRLISEMDTNLTFELVSPIFRTASNFMIRSACNKYAFIKAVIVAWINANAEGQCQFLVDSLDAAVLELNATEVGQFALTKRCTLELSRGHTPQIWFPCFSCWPEPGNSNGCCLACATSCHQNHLLGPERFSGFFCDCSSRQNRKKGTCHLGTRMK